MYYRICRIALVILSSLACHLSTKPPQPAADAKDKARFKERYGKDAFPLVPTWVLGLKIVTISFNLAELISELSKIFPTLLRWLQFTSPVTYGESLVDDTPIPTDYLLGVTLVVTGALIRVTSYRYLGRHFTWDVSLQRDHKLIVNGPYSIVRHPSYAGSVLFLAGALISQMGQGSWWNHHIWSMAAGKGLGLLYSLYLFLGLVVVVSRVREEDTVLRREFGDRWVEWSQRTPYRLIPYVY